MDGKQSKSSYRTRQQELLLGYLRQRAGAHFTADDVRAHFAGQGITIGTATIYRHLERFVADGAVNKYVTGESSAACYEYTGEGAEVQQHFHLKCERCGVLIHLSCDELSFIQEHLHTEHGFAVNPLRTVFYGTCAACAQKDGGKPADC